MNIKICYLYIEENEHEKFEVNLDNENEFVWNGEYLEVREKKNYIKNFYGSNINNFNLLIGKNGSGKTTCMNKIIDSIHSLENKMIKVMKINHIFHIFYYEGFNLSEHKVKLNSNIKIKLESYNIDKFGFCAIDEKSIHYRMLNNKDTAYQSIFCTNQFSKSSYFNSMVLDGIYSPYNMGLNHLLSFPEEMFDGISKNSNVINAYYNFSYYTLALLYGQGYCEKLFKLFDLIKPSKIRIINTNKYNIEKTLKRIEVILKEKVHEDISLNKMINNNQLEINVSNICFISILYNMLKRKRMFVYNNIRQNSSIDYETRLNHETIAWLNSIDLNENEIVYYYRKFEELKEIYVKYCDIKEIDTETFEIEYINSLNKYMELLDLVGSHIDKLEFDSQTEIGIYIDINKYIDVTKTLLLKITETIEDYTEFFVYDWCNSERKVINFSSGEEAVLSIFSRINFAFEKMNKINNHEKLEGLNEKKINGIIIFLDEPDVYLHPEWQRRLLYWLFQFVEIKFKGINVQIIVATNSPILAGDVLGKDIIYFKEGGVKSDDFDETFSRNLLSLLKKTFFMESLIGEFSIQKINKLISQLKNSKNNIKDDQMKFIDMIGEPVIRNRLERLKNKK